MNFKKLKFYKEANGSWYIDLPEYTGSKAELLMVEGADTLLDVLSKQKNEVILNVSLEPFDDATHLTLVKKGESEGGGYYYARSYNNQILDLDLWLCDVTNFVFGFIPPHIYFKVNAE